jgi:hypothetical protein
MKFTGSYCPALASVPLPCAAGYGCLNNSITSTVVLNSGFSLSIVYLGCFQDNVFRDLPLRVSLSTTVDGCTFLCQASRLPYFALQSNGECFCGSAYGTLSTYVQLPAASCGGINGLGGFWTNSVYRIRSWPSPCIAGFFCPTNSTSPRAQPCPAGNHCPSNATTPLPCAPGFFCLPRSITATGALSLGGNAAAYLGCVQDTADRDLRTSFSGVNTVARKTPQDCRDYCSIDTGFSYFALQHGSAEPMDAECRCGKAFNTTPAFPYLPDSQCAFVCTTVSRLMSR